MKTLELSGKNVSLADTVRNLGDQPVAVTDSGRPVAVLLPVGGADLETIALSLSPTFNAMLLRSAERHAKEGGLSEEQVRRRLGMVPANGTAAKRPAAKTKRRPAPTKPRGKP